MPLLRIPLENLRYPSYCGSLCEYVPILMEFHTIRSDTCSGCFLCLMLLGGDVGNSGSNKANAPGPTAHGFLFWMLLQASNRRAFFYNIGTYLALLPMPLLRSHLWKVCYSSYFGPPFQYYQYGHSPFPLPRPLIW